MLSHFTIIICFLCVFKSLNYGVFGTKKKTPTFYDKKAMINKELGLLRYTAHVSKHVIKNL